MPLFSYRRFSYKSTHCFKFEVYILHQEGGEQHWGIALIFQEYRILSFVIRFGQYFSRRPEFEQFFGVNFLLDAFEPTKNRDLWKKNKDILRRLSLAINASRKKSAFSGNMTS